VSARLATNVEVTALVRRVEAEGDFAAIVKRGDPERGALLLIVGSRGRHVACLERLLDISGAYRWSKVGPTDSAESAEVSGFLAKRTRFDGDFWAIEVDIADPERFIAETLAST